MAKRPDPAADDRRRQARAAQQAALARAKRRRTLDPARHRRRCRRRRDRHHRDRRRPRHPRPEHDRRGRQPGRHRHRRPRRDLRPVRHRRQRRHRERRPRRQHRRQGLDGSLGRLLLPALPGVRGDEQRHDHQPRGVRQARRDLPQHPDRDRLRDRGRERVRLHGRARPERVAGVQRGALRQPLAEHGRLGRERLHPVRRRERGRDATQKCTTDGTYRSWITANTAASAKADVSGTPTMFIDGEKTDTLSGQALVDRVDSLASA